MEVAFRVLNGRRASTYEDNHKSCLAIKRVAKLVRLALISRSGGASALGYLAYIKVDITPMLHGAQHVHIFKGVPTPTFHLVCP